MSESNGKRSRLVSVDKETLSQFSVLLLDMNHTFMFEFNRFSVREDYYSTYCEIGGKQLTHEQVNLAIRSCHSYMSELYESPAHYENFPTVEATLREQPCSSEFDDAEITLLIETFAQHEMGVIYPAFVDCIDLLSKSFRLGVISNLWAPKTRWQELLERSGLSNSFEVEIFSSDFNFIKPSPHIFETAIDRLNQSESVDKSEILMIGDSQRCDIGGAKNAGIKSAWVSNRRDLDRNEPMPDFVLRDLLELAELET